MGNRVKEDDKEKTIRGLLKLPENRRCINCNNLGPQYVCTTFFTFICTNCSGVHREFTHRVKSVSVAKFTAEEVTALQVGGNERARQIYFKYWDPHRHSFPDGSNLHRLRDFIKHVYVDRKYTGERSTGLPSLRLSDKEASNEGRKVDTYRGGSRSSYDEDKYERSYAERSSPCGKTDDRSIKYYYDERRSPRYSRANSRYGGYRKSPVRFEIVDDRFRDEGFGSRRFSPGDSKLPNRNTSMDSSCSPVARSLKEVLGENAPTLQIGEESTNGNLVEHVNDNSQSLIDFSSEMETPDAAAISQTQVSSFNTGSSRPSFQSSAKEDSSQVPSTNTLEILLFELSVPSALPGDDLSEAPGSDILSTNVPKHSSNDHQPQAPSSDGTVVKVTEEWPFQNTLQHQPSPSFAARSGSIPQQTTLSIGDSNNESSFETLPHNAQGSLSVCAEQSSEAVSRPVQDASIGVETQLVETNCIGRKELPADLFTASYLSIVTPVSGWQTAPPHGMVFNYYPNTMSAPAFSNPARSTNPFDISDERSQFPSVASSKGAAPYLSAPTGLGHASSFETYSSQLRGPQSTANASMMPPQSPSIESASSPCRPQGIGGFGGDGAVFGSINTTPQPNGRYPVSNITSQSSLMGGNPFG
ncbi:Arf GTPase activating protein [Parasponia andersonii]|uniref:Arf GTPase activating protein n=1 Tax=Parasponia andersonii TaxID=3476 RepID=A0A2P5BWA0_PARAD|nr:Arf GTPase activating protein [Parasponia andersonii]